MTRTQRARLIRQRVITGAVALFVAAWLVIAITLISGNDPALSRNRVATTSVASSTVTTPTTTTTASSTPASTASKSGGSTTSGASSVTTRSS